MAGALDMDPEQLRFVAEFCGGGFGSKIPGHAHMTLAPLISAGSATGSGASGLTWPVLH
jgi:CO/xanthine dehydrogenase Mo-binding subunit